MEFLEKYWRAIAGICALTLIIGLIAAIVANSSNNKEIKSQENFAVIEAEYNKYREDQARNAVPPSLPSKDRSKVAPPAPVDLAPVRAQLEVKLKEFINGQEKTVAGEMASLYLSEILMSSGKNDEALSVLQKVDSSDSHLTSILVRKKMGALLADQGQCDEALTIWEKIIKTSAAKFAHAEVKIMQSLCYQKKNDFKRAEEILTSVKNDKTDSGLEYVQHAEKMLRLIQFKKAAGT